MNKIILSVFLMLAGHLATASDMNQEIIYISWCSVDQKVISSTADGEEIVLAECAKETTSDVQTLGVCKEKTLISTKGRVHISAQCETQK